MTTRIRTNWRLLKGVNARITRANLSLVAAGGAFFAMLSLFPAIAALIAVLGYVADPVLVDEQLDLLVEFIPADAYSLIDTQVRRLTLATSSTLGWASAISLAAALWSARAGTDAVIKAMNAVHGAPMRGGVRAAMVALAITLALILVVIVALLTMVVLPIAMALLPPGPYVAVALEAARWLVALLVVFSGIWVLYRFAPNGPAARVRWLNPGAVLAVLVWATASWSFSTYLTNFGNYNEVYGSIGAVIALLMFLYITIYVVLLGAAMNAELHERRDAADAAPDAAPAAMQDRPTAQDSGARQAASAGGAALTAGEGPPL